MTKMLFIKIIACHINRKMAEISVRHFSVIAKEIDSVECRVTSFRVHFLQVGMLFIFTKAAVAHLT